MDRCQNSYRHCCIGTSLYSLDGNVCWETKGKEVFKAALPRDVQTYKRIGRQSGLYNGFLSAGLIWSFLIKDPQWQDNVALFFLGCVAVAVFTELFLLLRRSFLSRHCLQY
jgi:hypothetical protein